MSSTAEYAGERQLHIVQPEQDHPHQFEGDFYFQGLDGTPATPLPLPSYDTGVESRKTVDKIDYDGLGTGWLEEWRMSDGVVFDVEICEPKRRKTDVAVLEDTSWTTQVLGLNEDSARESMSLGMVHITKGPEKEGQSIPLSHSAYNSTKVLQEVTRTGHTDAEAATLKGFSRGSMIAFGTAAYAEASGRKILYANLTDPCLAEEFTMGLDRMKAVLERPLDIPAEALTLGIEAARLLMNPVRLWHYRKTVDLSLDGARQVRATGKPLFTGEAGFLAHHFPKDIPASICFFLNSSSNQQALYREILADHTQVEFKNARGGHVAGMDKKVLGHISTRFLGLVNQLADGVSHADIDYSLVHRN